MPNAAVLGRNLRPARSSLQGTQLERYGNDRGSAMCPMFPRSSVSNRGQLRWHLMCLAEMSSEEKANGAASGRLKTTKVKFLLQRECMFGEQYKVIGGDPILGEWDPNAAVPLEWSEGHNWTAELEVPHGKKYKYKFLLFCKSGEIQWQPGPNRVFSTSQKLSSLVVSQPWDFDGTCPDSEVGHAEAEDAPSEIEETEKEQGLLEPKNLESQNLDPEAKPDESTRASEAVASVSNTEVSTTLLEETEKEQGSLEPKNFEPQNIDPEAKPDDSTRASKEVASVSNTEVSTALLEETEKEQGLLEPKNFEPQNIDPEAKSDDSTRASEEVASVSNTEEESLVAEDHSDVSISGGNDADSSGVAVSNIEEEILVAENHSGVCISEVAVSNIEEEISVAESGAHDADSSEVKIEEESLVAEDNLDVCISGGHDAGSIEAVEPGSADVVQDTSEVQSFKNDAQNDVNDVSITVWRKDRAWVHKVLSALSALFRR